MGAGVSLSLTQNGFSVRHLIVGSDPFARDLDVYFVCNPPDLKGRAGVGALTKRGHHTQKGFLPFLNQKRYVEDRSLLLNGAFIPGLKPVSGDADGTINAAAEFGDSGVVFTVSLELQSAAPLRSRLDPSECGVNLIFSVLDLRDIISKSNDPGSILLNRIKTRLVPVITGEFFPTQPSRIRRAESGVSDLGFLEPMESVVRDTDPGCNGDLSSGPHRALRTMTKLYGSSGLLRSDHGSLDPLDGDNDGLLVGRLRYIIKATTTTVISTKGVLATSAIGKNTINGFDPLFQSDRPGSDAIGAPVTFQAANGHVLCHRVQIRYSPRAGALIWVVEKGLPIFDIVHFYLSRWWLVTTGGLRPEFVVRIGLPTIGISAAHTEHGNTVANDASSTSADPGGFSSNLQDFAQLRSDPIQSDIGVRPKKSVPDQAWWDFLQIQLVSGSAKAAFGMPSGVVRTPGVIIVADRPVCHGQD